YKYEKNGRVALKEVQAFQEFLKEINIKLSKRGLKSTTLLDTNALFFSNKLIPYLHKYEWSIRKLIYLVLPSHFSESWIEESISKEKRDEMQKKLRGNYDPNNLLQEMTLFDLEDYLFGRNYILVRNENEETVVRFRELESEELLSYICDSGAVVSNPYSLWEEIFNKYVDIELNEIHEDMILIRKGRNIVGHNKELQNSVYSELIKKLKKFIRHLEDAFQKILIGDIKKEDINTAADDFEGYIKNNWIRTDSAVLGSATKDMAKTISALQGLNKQGMRLATQDTAKGIANIPGLNKRGMGLATQDMAKRIANIPGLNKQGMRLATQDTAKGIANIPGLNKQGMRLATQDTAKRIANIPGLNKQGMRLATQDTAKGIANIPGLNKQGMRLATQDTAKGIANIPGLNKQGMGLATQGMAKRIANIPGLNKQGMRLALQDTEKMLTSNENDLEKEV
ncbi:TPA: hypothetical protein ACIZDY_002838, partial [Enterococcus faecalis]